MGERRLYVYRLHVDIPEDRQWPWEPPDYDPNAGPWQWPRWTRYLSKSGAEGRAELLRKYGATVTIERSNPVTWGNGDG